MKLHRSSFPDTFFTATCLSHIQWVRVGRYSLLVLLTSLLWCVGLSLCGPLRTVLLSEHSDLALGSLLSILACTHTQGKVGDPAILGMVMIFLFLRCRGEVLCFSCLVFCVYFSLTTTILLSLWNIVSSTLDFYRLSYISMNPL